jgi:hypothetical protein
MTDKIVVVSTLWCRDHEILQCEPSLNKQLDVKIERVLIVDEEEHTAHKRLYRSWNENVNKSRGAILVKLDPDMEFNDDYALHDLYELHKKHEKIAHIQCSLFDTPTDQIINGLNSYGTNVSFNDPTDQLRPDRGILPRGSISLLANELSVRFNPIGQHARVISPAQAFRYGLHRARKNHVDVLHRVQTVHVNRLSLGQLNKSLWFILSGAQKSVNNKIGVSYNDKEFQLALSESEIEFADFVKDASWLTVQDNTQGN